LKETSIEMTSAAERRRLRFEFDDAELLGRQRSDQKLGAAESFEFHKRRWKLARSCGGGRCSPRLGS
jgi:hypothetical protein